MVVLHVVVVVSFAVVDVFCNLGMAVFRHLELIIIAIVAAIDEYYVGIDTDSSRVVANLVFTIEEWELDFVWNIDGKATLEK